MSLGQSFNISLKSMQNNQYALSVVSHNIANINTEGYVKKRVDFQEDINPQYGTDILSKIKSLNGSSISAISDYLDSAALNDLMNSTSDANYYNTLADALSGLEDATDALGDNGLNSLLNDFYAAAADLEKHPDDIAIRQVYANAAQNVCEKFNEVSDKFATLKQDMKESVNSDVATINSLLSQLAQTNEEYVKSGQNSSVLSQMYSILNEISQYMNVVTDTNPNGTINLYIGNTKVVQGGVQNYTLNADLNPQDGDKNISLYLQSTTNEDYKLTKGINEAFKSGSIASKVDYLNGDIPQYHNYDDISSMIDEAANAFAQTLNSIQTYKSPDGKIFAGCLSSDANGNTILIEASDDMFVAKDGSAQINASNITVNPDILKDVSKISAARIDLDKYADENGNVDENWKYAIGNSDNAVEITNVQNSKICTYNGVQCSLSEFLSGAGAKVGLDVDNVSSKANTYQTIADDATTAYTNAVGVNLDEELADMLKYQRAYEASAKIFSVVNGLYDVIFGMV